MSDAIQLALTRLATEEGFRSLPYKDQTGHLSIGYGCNLSAGWGKGLAAIVLQYQLGQVAAAIEKYWWWQPDQLVRSSVILDLAFNMGIGGLLHFVNMLAAYGKKDWKTAATELLNSKAAREVPERYQALAKLMEEGQ